MNSKPVSAQILVTGASGFIGRHLITLLCEEKVRWQSLNFRNFCKSSCSDDFAGVDVIIHLAAMVHILRGPSEDDVKNYWAVNVDATRKLAVAAATSGVRRFIFISSIKVNGEYTTDNTKFRSTDSPHPAGLYAKTKYQAEIELMKISAETGMEVVVIRPPLVYGPGVKANFKLLEKLIALRVPLPFSGIDNKRSIVSIFNLTDLIMKCLHHSAAANKVFLVADARAYSTSELSNQIAKAMGISSFIFYFPQYWLYLICKFFGKLSIYGRLSASLEVDFSDTTRALGWSPRFSTQESLQKVYSTSDC